MCWIFLEGMKAQADEGGGRILLGDNTGGGAIMLRPIRFQLVGVLDLTGLPCIYMYSWAYVYWIATCAKFDLRRTFRNVTTAYVGEVLYIK
jgi:hypothetical protein